LPKLDQYRNKYENIHFERTDDGILTWRWHTKGGPLVWSFRALSDVAPALADLTQDRENNLLILTGTGAEMIGSIDYRPTEPPNRTVALTHWGNRGGPTFHEHLFALHLPVIAAINGPIRVHSELAVLSDIVLASPDTVFQDLPHFPSGLVPGDGVSLTWQMLLGPNRARYFLWTGQEIGAQEARDLGVVNEIVPKDKLVSRAHDLARLILKQPKLVRTFTRQALIRNIKKAHFEEAQHVAMLELAAWSMHGPPADILPK